MIVLPLRRLRGLTFDIRSVLKRVPLDGWVRGTTQHRAAPCQQEKSQLDEPKVKRLKHLHVTPTGRDYGSHDVASELLNFLVSS